MNHFLLLGNHLELALAEAKAVMGGEKPFLCDHLALFSRSEWDGLFLQNRLAGAIKLGDILASIPLDQLNADQIAELVLTHPRGQKILFGLSLFGGSTTTRKRFKHLPIELKKRLKEEGRSVRWVTGDAGEISPAAVAKLELTSEGYDICIGFTPTHAHIGFTTHVQDADAWSLRDFGRPIRDTLNGMLPPKLARMMVNLGIGANPHGALLDPFCGGGTTLMEASLMSRELALIGSDIEAKQIHDSQTNFDWMVKQNLLSEAERQNLKLIVSPAQYLQSHFAAGSIDTIVTEGYLGRPLRGHETQQQLEEQAKDIESMWDKAFATFANIQRPNGKLVTIAPEFQTSHGHTRVQLSTLAEKHGYTRQNALQDWHQPTFELAYARPDQRVKRLISIFVKEKV